MPRNYLALQGKLINYIIFGPMSAMLFFLVLHHIIVYISTYLCLNHIYYKV